MKPKAALCVLLACSLATAAASAGCRGPMANLRISKSGVVAWDGQPFKNHAAVVAKFKAIASREPQQEIFYEIEPNSDPKIVDAVLSAAKKAGIRCIGTTGLDQYIQD